MSKQIHELSNSSELDELAELLSDPNLLKRFVGENKLIGLEPERLSYLITCICIVAHRPSYGSNLHSLDRDTLCVRIAKEPALLAKLLPAARIIFLARLKQMTSTMKSEVPRIIQEAAEQSYSLPLGWNADYNNGIGLRAFWLPSIMDMNYECDYYGRFRDVLDCAFIRNNYHNTPKGEAEALALAVVLDPRFVRGFPNSNNPCRPLAQLSSSDSKQLIERHNLSGKIKGYEEFTKTLESIPAYSAAEAAANSAVGAGAGANAGPALVYSAAGTAANSGAGAAGPANAGTGAAGTPLALAIVANPVGSQPASSSRQRT